MKVVLVTGGFDPIHQGHIQYFKAAKALGDKLVVGINSDEWLTRKKGRPFMEWYERSKIIQHLDMVDYVIEFNDDDNTSNNAIKLVKQTFPDSHIIFANGGDRTKDNIPEMVFEDVEFVFGIGGAYKANSSSWILSEWKAPKTKRSWGYYRVLHEEPGVKVKELAVDPGQSLSYQRHFERSEFWLVSEGTATIITQATDQSPAIQVQKRLHENIHIPTSSWHQLRNDTDTILRIVEIQYGTSCREEDIERNS